MDSEQEFFEFIKMHPELKSVAKSDFFASVLEFIKEKPCSFNSLRENFSFIPFSDLKTITDALNALELIQKEMNYGEESYSLTVLGRQYLQKYRKKAYF